jgi:hypothetical protein
VSGIIGYVWFMGGEETLVVVGLGVIMGFLNLSKIALTMFDLFG